ncbi:MAG: permease, partial [Aquificota bacterium]
MDYVIDFFSNFYTYTKEILPYFFLALLVTSLLEAYTNLSWLKKLTSKDKSAPLYTALLAGLLPLCSCSMVPVANLINSNSRSYAPVVSFLIVAPVISPITLILTYGVFGLDMTLFRLF